MWRRLIVWCGVWMMLLTVSGCHSGQELVAPVTNGFTCDTAIRYKEMAIAGTLTRSTAGGLELTLSAPASLEGVTLEWSGNGVKASLYGIAFEVDPGTLPVDALGGVLTRALDTVGRTPDEGQLTEAGWEWQGTIDNQKVILLSDPTDGTPLSLQVPSIPLTVEFNEVKMK